MVLDGFLRFAGTVARHDHHPVRVSLNATIAGLGVCIFISFVHQRLQKGRSFLWQVGPWYLTCCYLLQSEVWERSFVKSMSERQMLILIAVTLHSIVAVIRSVWRVDEQRGVSAASHCAHSHGISTMCLVLGREAALLFLAAQPLYFAMTIHPSYGQRPLSWLIDGPMMCALYVCGLAHATAVFQFETWREAEVIEAVNEGAEQRKQQVQVDLRPELCKFGLWSSMSRPDLVFYALLWLLLGLHGVLAVPAAWFTLVGPILLALYVVKVLIPEDARSGEWSVVVE